MDVTNGRRERQREKTNLLIGNCISRLAHELLNVLDAAHLGVDLAQHFGALLQAKDNVLLDQRELDARC